MYGIRHLLQNPTAWSPFEEFERLHARLERGGVSLPSAPSAPTIQLWSEGDGLRLSALLPGVRPEDLEISVQGEALTIRGTRATSGAEDGQRWLRQERSTGAFAHSIQLPFAIHADGVKARLANGVLEMELPRSAAEAPRRIPVQDS